MKKHAVWIIRADGNPQIGSGHIMRTLAIASELRKQEARVIFVCADSCMQEIIEDFGFSLKILNTDSLNIVQELPVFEELIKQWSPDAILVDSYAVNARYLQEIGKNTPLVYFDDFGTCPYCAAGIISYGISAQKDIFERMYEKTQTKLWIGTQYVPLREEFTIQQPPPIHQAVCNILLTVGGGDSLNITSTVLRTFLERKVFKNVTIQVIVGKLNPNKKIITILSEKHPKRIVIHENVTEMASLMCQCDLAISAGGTTLYELCACGVPTICFCYADNQEAHIQEFAKKGVIPFAGDYRTEPQKVIERFIQYFEDMKSVTKRKQQQEKMRLIVDGRGAERLAQELQKLY